MDGGWAQEGEEGRQGDQGVEQAQRDEQHHHLAATSSLPRKYEEILGREHLEECADGHEVLMGKDDHAEEGGESTMKDVRSGPE